MMHTEVESFTCNHAVSFGFKTKTGLITPSSATDHQTSVWD